ncbi:MAG: hypothetical protein M0C28_15765 [Candidatus Moduliflexus flocculans]|nr:hypothetical protein [Candidatus Moduliflexus flocculans]
MDRLSGDVFIPGRLTGPWTGPQAASIEIYYLNLMLEFGLEPETAAETVIASRRWRG